MYGLDELVIALFDLLYVKGVIEDGEYRKIKATMKPGKDISDTVVVMREIIKGYGGDGAWTKTC